MMKMKDKWRNYALKDGKVKSSYIREYINRKKGGKARETSNSNCIFPSGREEETEEKIRNQNELTRNNSGESKTCERIFMAECNIPRTQIDSDSETESNKGINQSTDMQKSSTIIAKYVEDNDTLKGENEMAKKEVIAKGVEESKSKAVKARKEEGGSNVGKYKSVKSSEMAGTAGGAPKGSYPINTEKRAKAALAYAHNAPNPAGIKAKVHAKYPGLGKKKA